MSLARMAEPATTPRYERHRPEQTLLYQLVQTHYPEFCAQLDAQGRRLPAYVRQEFEDFLLCGRLEHGFLRVRCEDCKHERLVAFSCKRRGFCPSCGARRMAESAALLVDEVLPAVPIRQWVLSFPYQLRLLLAQQPDMMGKVLEIVYRTLATHLIRKAGFNKHSAQTGAVTLIQRFGSALNLNLHFHMLFLDGVYAEDQYGAMRFHRVKAPTREELGALVHQLSQRVSRYLEKKGWLQRDMENTYLLLDGDDDALLQFQGYSVTYPTGLPSGHRPGARCSACKVFHQHLPKNQIGWPNRRAFPSMPVSWPTASRKSCVNGYAAIFPGLRCRKSGWRSRVKARFAMNSKLLTVMAPPMCFLSLWTSLHAWPPWFPSRG